MRKRVFIIERGHAAAGDHYAWLLGTAPGDENCLLPMEQGW